MFPGTHAAMRSGLYITFINSQPSADEVAYIVDDCDAHIFVATEKYAPITQCVVEQTPRVERRIAFGSRLDAFLRERIAHYKLPRRYEFTDDLPRTPTGKLVRAGCGSGMADSPAPQAESLDTRRPGT